MISALPFIANPRAAFCALVGMVVLMLLIHGALTLYGVCSGHDTLLGLAPLFQVENESSVPTVFSVLQLAFAALLAYLAGEQARSLGHVDIRHWRVAAAILLLLDIDEGAAIHEGLGANVVTLVLNAPWSIKYPVLIVVILFLLAVTGWLFLRLWLPLSSRPRRMLALGTVLFLLGAVVVDALGTYYFHMHPPEWHAFLIGILEEGLEMLGISVVVYGLCTLLNERSIPV
jgi:hypothetical protein